MPPLSTRMKGTRMYGNAMSGLDTWLEAPYVDAARAEAGFEAWCEREDVPFDAPDAWERYEAAMEDEREAYLENKAESAREDRMMERDEW